MGSTQRHRRSGRAQEAVTGVVWGSQQAVPEPHSPALVTEPRPPLGL